MAAGASTPCSGHGPPHLRRARPGRGDRTVIGVDISAAALDGLRRLAGELGLEHRIELRVGSVLELPLADASVDAVVDRSVLIYVEDKTRVAREYRRVLRPGGRVSIFEPVNAEARDEYGFDLGPIRELHDRVEARKQAEWAGPSRSMVDFGVEDLRRAFTEAGFPSVHVELDEWELSTTSGEEWRRSLEATAQPALAAGDRPRARGAGSGGRSIRGVRSRWRWARGPSVHLPDGVPERRVRNRPMTPLLGSAGRPQGGPPRSPPARHPRCPGRRLPGGIVRRAVRPLVRPPCSSRGDSWPPRRSPPVS